MPSIALICAQGGVEASEQRLEQSDEKRTHGVGDVGKVDKAALLLLEEVDELDLAVLAKVLAQLVLVVRLKVLDVADCAGGVMNVSTRTLPRRRPDARRHCASRQPARPWRCRAMSDPTACPVVAKVERQWASRGGSRGKARRTQPTLSLRLCSAIPWNDAVW